MTAAGTGRVKACGTSNRQGSASAKTLELPDVSRRKECGRGPGHVFASSAPSTPADSAEEGGARLGFGRDELPELHVGAPQPKAVSRAPWRAPHFPLSLRTFGRAVAGAVPRGRLPRALHERGLATPATPQRKKQQQSSRAVKGCARLRPARRPGLPELLALGGLHGGQQRGPQGLEATHGACLTD